MIRGSYWMILLLVVALLPLESPAKAVEQDRSVLIVVNIQSGLGAKHLKRDFIFEIVRNRLRSFGIRAVVYEGNDVGTKTGKMDLPQRRLVLEIKTTLNGPVVEFSADCAFSYFEPVRVDGTESAKRTWHRTQVIYGRTLQVVEDNLVEYSQKVLRGFIPVHEVARNGGKRS